MENNIHEKCTGLLDYHLTMRIIVFSLPQNEPLISTEGVGRLPWPSMLHHYISTAAQNTQTSVSFSISLLIAKCRLFAYKYTVLLHILIIDVSRAGSCFIQKDLILSLTVCYSISNATQTSPINVIVHAKCQIGSCLLTS